jgi:L-ascorbate metabolism protein UlaG (beta-lactamase superfamily)
MLGSSRTSSREGDTSQMHNPSACDPKAWSDERLTVANLGHATLLANFFGVRLISDPTLFDRIGVCVNPFFTLGPRRIVAPALSPPQLDPVDVILVTHAHMDHLDVRSLRALSRKAVVVTARGCSRIIGPLGYDDVRELRWGESTEVSGLKITAIGARHWGKRWPPFGTDYGFASYVLEKQGCRMLLACDSAYTELFRELSRQPLDVAAFSIGAYNPFIWNHANPEEVWRMFVQSGANYLIPIHWGTFRLSREPIHEPMARLVAAAGEEEERIVIRKIGGAWSLPDTRGARALPPEAAPDREPWTSRHETR